MLDISSEEKVQRAERLKRARLLAGLSRKEMGEGEAAIHTDTYKGWESARFGGLTDKGAQKVMEKFKAHGFNCSATWLLYGIGSSPFQDHSIDLHSPDLTHLFEDEAEQMAKELLAFKTQKNSIDFCIRDDWMSPWYLPGDLVAGIKIPLALGAKIPGGFDCIVQLSSGEILLRKTYPGKSEGLYNLLTHNPSGSFLSEVKLDFVAPVLWWRRPLNTVLK